MNFGCCYAIVESHQGLVDWGAKRVPVRSKNRRTVAAVLTLVQRYRPDVLVLEDCRAPESRRCGRVRKLILRLEAAARGEKVRVAFVAPNAVRRDCAAGSSATKHDVALRVAERFPELARWLPPKRKLWMSEHWRMGIFDAVALAVTVLEAGPGGRRRPPARGDP